MTDNPNEALWLAISDPNATTPRLPNEHIDHWRLRALLAQHATLVASLPDDVLEAELVKRGRLTEAWRGAGVTFTNRPDAEEFRDTIAPGGETVDFRLASPWREPTP